MSAEHMTTSHPGVYGQSLALPAVQDLTIFMEKGITVCSSNMSTHGREGWRR